MKKTATLLFILMGCASLLSAQKFEIAITSITAVNSKGTDVNLDSVHIGQLVVLNIQFKNNGAFPKVGGNYQPTDFPGGYYSFNFNVSPDGNKNKVDSTKTLYIPPIAYGGNFIIHDTIYINKDFFKSYNSDTLNIFIVWPSGGSIASKNDSLDSIPFNTVSFYVYPHNAGINTTLAQNQFSMFPNPAKEVLNIKLDETGNGMIRLMDMAGKVIISKPYPSMSGENINLPINEGAGIPDGLYLVGIQTSSGNHVEKVMICR